MRTYSNQAADHSSPCCLRLVFASHSNEQPGFSLKYLVPLAGIGRAYVRGKRQKQNADDKLMFTLMIMIEVRHIQGFRRQSAKPNSTANDSESSSEQASGYSKLRYEARFE